MVIGVFFFFRQRNGTLDKASKEFSVKDTTGIDKIFMADKAGHSVTLHRQSNGTWLVNSKYPVESGTLNTLLLTVQNLEVKAPVPKAGRNSVIARLASSAVKVEIYKYGELIKIYYVGGPTQDYLGTYMLLEGSGTPFIMHLPGFNGFLTTRYSPVEEDWRRRLVFNYPENSIAAVSITYPFHPELSFALDVASAEVKGSGEQPVLKLKARLLKSYLSFFQRASFEGWESTFTQYQKDSLMALTPVSILKVKDNQASEKTVKVYLRKGSESPFDPERMYAVDDEQNFLIIQHYVFDKILATYKDFQGNQSK